MESYNTRGDRREAERQRARYGMRVTGRHMARTIAQSQAKRLHEMERKAAQKGK